MAPSRVTRAGTPVLLSLLVLLVLAGCSGGSGGQQGSPAQSLATAKKALDTTSGVHLVLATDQLPDGVSGVLRAEGVGTHAPAFEGTIKAKTNGVAADVDVVAVGGDVYAELPFTAKFTKVDPAEFNAPDPAGLLRRSRGLSSLLTSATGVQRHGQVRQGKQVLTEYTGRLPGKAVAAILPSVSGDDAFTVTFTLDDDDRLTETELTGPFYPDAEDLTYTVTFDQYGAHPDITRP